MRGQKQAIAFGVGSAPGSPHALKEAGHGGWCIDLDHPIQITHIDTQLQYAGRHDHAIRFGRERPLGAAALVLAQRAVSDKRLDLKLPQLRPEFLGASAAVNEHQAFFAPVQPGYDDCRILE